MNTDTHTHTTHCWWDLHEARWVCRPTTAVPPAHPDPTDEALVDVRDMVVVHTALLREFRLAPRAVTSVADGDTRQAAVVDRHLALISDLLHHHHEGEDELLWPKVRSRVSPAAVALLHQVEAQHVDIEAALLGVTAARVRWTRTANESHRDALAVELQRLHDLLREHLNVEELTILPLLAAAVLTEAEWRAVGEAAVAAMPKPDLVLAFGMFAYEGDPAVLRDMLASAPAVPRMLLPRLAPHVYARRARKVHGTRRP